MPAGAHFSMAQQSVLGQSTLLKDKRTSLPYQWMRYFFTEVVSPANRSVVDLQRRAVWIGLALLLQAGNEIDHGWYFPFLISLGSLIPLALFLGSFFALWMAFRPANATSSQQHTYYSYRQQPARWQRNILIAALLLTTVGATQFGDTALLSASAPQFSNDGTTLDTNAALLLLQGRNPYTDSNFPDILRRFTIQPNWTTPLRQGQFANRLDYPTMAELQSVLDTSLKAQNVPEFESKVSYPALSFLSLVPFVLFKNYNVLPFYLMCYILLVLIAWRVVRPELRPWLLLLSMANVPMWASVVGGNLDIFYILLLVVAWLFRDRRWTSAIFFGLALATKQIAWFFIPFYMIMVWRHYGLKDMLYRTTVAGALALAINLPFILWNPQAWFAGVMAPVADPMFPMGVGFIDLSITHLIPYLPSWVYQALEAAAMLGSLVWYWRICRQHPEAAMLLAVLPIFFAWRSLSSYFYCAAFPMFILMAAKRKSSQQHELSPLATRKLTESQPVPVTL